MKTINRAPVLITGASNGIGYATALALCSQDTPVIALSRNGSKLEQLRKEAGSNCTCIQFDLLRDDPATLLLHLEREGITAIGGLIHNAGLLVNKAFAEISKSELQAVYETNVFAPYQLTQVVLPYLKASGNAHIVHISSMGGIQGSAKFPGLSAYSSSKGALCILTECLALELKEHNISVNCLALGAVQTEMLQAAFPGYTAPLQPGEIASFIAWFAGEGNKFFNGKILPVATSTP